MRTTLSILIACASLMACDVEKSVGDDATGADSSPPETAGASTTSPADTDGAEGTGTEGTSNSGATASDTSTPPTGGGGETTAQASTGAEVCPEFDAGPVGDPDVLNTWECMCETCELSFPDIPLETVELFESGGLCDCLCAEAGCGSVEGEGGFGTGPVDGTDGDDTEGGTSGGSEPGTDSSDETTDGA